MTLLSGGRVSRSPCFDSHFATSKLRADPNASAGTASPLK